MTKNAIITWKAPEYNYFERGILWKIIALGIVGVLVFLSFYHKSWSLGLLILAFVLFYSLSFLKKPKVLDVEINKTGIKYGKLFLKFEQIKSFWIIFNPPFTRALYLKTQNKVFDELKIIIPNESPDFLRSVLKMKLKEIKGKEDSAHNILLKIFKIY